MKLKKYVIKKYLEKNRLPPVEFCMLNRINITLFKKLMQEDTFIEKEAYLNALIRISQAIGISILDLIEK